MSEQAPRPMHEPKGMEGQQDHVPYTVAEVPNSTPDSLTPEQSHLPAVTGEAVEDTELRASWEAAEEQRAAWRDMLKDTTHLTMPGREFELLRDVGLGNGGDTRPFLIDKTRQNYGIPVGVQYVSVDVTPNDANSTHTTELVAVNEEDFGTTIDEGRLESHGVKPGDTPHLTMTGREFDLFRAVGLGGSTSSHIQYARARCGIPQEDQYAPQYALIDIESDDPGLPNKPLLVDVTEADFGTVIDREVVDMDFEQPDSDPNDPSTPERPNGALKTVDISDTLVASGQELRVFAESLMRDRTTDPFSTQNGDIGVRAGGLMPGQQDAYIWTTNPITKSIELTLAFPGQYDSVCVVRGQKREAANGKVGMAQIENPQEVFKIEGENLERLQNIYRGLYQQPNYALTDAQREDRDQLYDGYLKHLISNQAELNERQEQARRDDEYRRHHQPQLRAREIPRS